jgi:DNA-binding IclR family transcriptional regulator
LPVTQDLAEAIGQSCHLVVATEERMTVVAQAEPRRPMIFAVKHGADFPLSAHRVSTRVLAAFASQGRRDEMLRAMITKDRTPEPAALRERLDHIAQEGYAMVPSEMIGGVVDLAFRVFDQDGWAKASLSVPLAPQIGRTPEPETLKAKVAEAARRISAAIGWIAEKT